MNSRRFLPILLIGLAALIVGACGKAPLVPDVPRGPATWMRNFATACTTFTTDPSGGQVSYQFDWGDGAKSQWSQFMDGGISFADTHSYTELGPYDIKVRAKNSKKASGWSEPLSINVSPGEGGVLWSFGFLDPDEDSADFSINSFAIGPDNTAYIGCGSGAVIARKQSGSFWKFVQQDPFEFYGAPVLADDGTIFIGCSNDSVYILNSGGTVRSRAYVGGAVNATGALAADGTTYFQTEDSMVVAIRSDGSQSWSFPSNGGNCAPVVGVDNTVYVASQDGSVWALDPSSGTTKWGPYNLGAVQIVAPPAIDPSRNALYVANDDGKLVSIDLSSGTANWESSVGTEASGPVVGTDGTVYIGGGGKLQAVNPDDGQAKWVFVPPLSGVVSTPAVTVDGYVYVLVVGGKKKLALQSADTLYAVNPDNTRRWACGLGEGMSDSDYPLSAPKVDASGLIYVGNGTRAWCVVGVSAPAASVWPMFQRDVVNSGRAR